MAMILHLQALNGLGTNWANEVNLVMNHAPGAGSITTADRMNTRLTVTIHCQQIFHSTSII